MKTIIFYSIVFISIFLAGNGYGASQGQPGFMQGAQSDFAQAEKELNQAAQEFQKEAEQTAKGMQQNGQTSWSQASTATPGTQPQQQGQPAAQPNPMQGSPETGYAGTWTDPATGDIITSVIAPKPAPNTTQNYPMIIEPQVGGYYGNSGQNPQTGWSQWQTSQDNPGYPPQNPPYNQPPPPGWHPYYPGQPYPGFNPYPYPYPQPYPGYEQGSFPSAPPMFAPGMPGSQPPPINPNYRPLRPGQGNTPGSIWQPGMNPPGSGMMPPNSGWTPPANSWQPPATATPPPSMPSLPLQPSGQSWHRSPFSPSSGGGMFGKPGVIRHGSN